MENIQWIFSGIGTEIFSLLIGGIIGGLVIRLGYIILQNKYKKQGIMQVRFRNLIFKAE